MLWIQPLCPAELSGRTHPYKTQFLRTAVIIISQKPPAVKCCGRFSVQKTEKKLYALDAPALVCYNMIA